MAGHMEGRGEASREAPSKPEGRGPGAARREIAGTFGDGC